MQLSLGKLRQNKRNKTKLWGGFYGWIISSKMKITQSKKQLTFWRTLLIFGFVVCGPSSVKKMCLLILQAAFFLSTGGFLFSSLLLPAYGAWPCFSFTTLSNLPRQKNIGVLMEALIVFNTLKGCLASVWGLTWAVNHVSDREHPMPPQPAPPQAPQHPAHDCEEISNLNSTVLHNHSLSPKNDNFVIIYSAHDVQNPYTNIN